MSDTIGETDDSPTLLQLNLSAAIFYNTGTGFLKVSLLLFYLRIFPRRTLHIAAGYNTAEVIANIFSCNPGCENQHGTQQLFCPRRKSKGKVKSLERHGIPYQFVLRPHFPSGFSSREQLVACYHTGLPVTITPKGQSFDEVALKLREFYRSGIKHSKDALPNFGQVLGDIFSQGIPPSSTPVVSSLGINDNYLQKSFASGSIRIKDVRIADPMRSAEIQAFLWS
ncbi:hypothetical protein BJX70DRAFT_402317 [Aspergillus crustosus]